jgi:hypothetical protein
MTITITITINGREFTAEFLKSEDCGYAPGKLLLDLPNGEYISIYKNGRKWVEARISGNVCRESHSHPTRIAACESAAMSLAGRTLEHESMTA